ncbi:MAG: hypothetical protein K2O40_05175 [Lachnospiraceae bacterium]|nr:hypothetical protein [Lachnospiraceae bacterium]
MGRRRGFKLQATQQNEDFAHLVRIKLVEHDVTRKKLMELTGVGSGTMVKRIGRNNPAPDEMSVQELRIYRKVLKLSDEEILNFIR